MNAKCIRTTIAVTIVGLVTAQVCCAARFIPLGFLPGGESSFAEDVSNDGSVVVGSASNSAGFIEAFRWTRQSGIDGLGDLPGGDSISAARAVSHDGTVVVGTGSGQTVANSDAFRWTIVNGMEPLGYLPNDGFQFSYGQGLSADGLIAVGGSRSALGNEAYRWTSSEGMVGLGDLDGGPFESFARNISGDGEVIVGDSKSGAAREPFRWTATDGMFGLGLLPGPIVDHHTYAVSFDGSVVAGTAGHMAWRWTVATCIAPIPNLPNNGTRTQPEDMTADGSVLVGSATDATGEHAMIWTAVYGTQDLQDFLLQNHGLALTGWRLTAANGISDDGSVIVGQGINSTGQTEAWLINLSVPEPATSLLLMIVGFALASIRRREGVVRPCV